MPIGLQGVMANAVRLHQSGKLREAEAFYGQILDQVPDNPDALHLVGVLAYQTNRPAEAAKRIEAAIAVENLNAAYYDNLSLCYRALGRAEDAMRACRKAIALDGRNPGSHFNLAASLVDLGRPNEARRALERAIKRDPNYAEAHNNLANLLMKSGEIEPALSHYRKAAAARPGYLEPVANMARALADAERHDESVEYFRQLAEPDDADAELLTDYANALHKAGKPSEALTICERALQSDPNSAKAVFLCAVLQKEHGDQPGAEKSYRRAAELDPDLAEIYNNLGNLLYHADQVEEALACYETYVEKGDQKASGLLSQASCHIALGDQDKAKGLIEQALAFEPDNVVALTRYADLGGKNKEDFSARLESAASRPDLARGDKQRAAFALAHYQDQQGNWDSAFRWAETANALARESLPYDPAVEEQWIERIMAVFDRSFLDARPQDMGLDSDQPIFIVGMPRSGTTLIEQMLASHPAVHGAGEREEIGRLASNLQAITKSYVGYPDCVADFTPDMATEAARQYLDTVGEKAGDALRMTDKMPLNFRHLGLISMIFPNARVIHCRRDPMDVCLSCYLLGFAGRMAFAYDLQGLGHYYRLYDRLMAHWREVQPLRMLEVQYEDLVENFETRSREIVEFAGLEWDERCLRFHETKRTVLTASNLQVRQPLYSKSIGRWRNYEAGLGPLREALGDLAL
ncbi:MAG: tetratricopeptide repeat protein [Rhodospirillaceae bacterium]|nr:tetratricopeptide repeat protein [Rhodospirillaceae bacterium]